MLEMPERLYELKEVVAILARSATPDEVNRILRHVRHWTSMDLLTPAGDKYTGTGNSRKYTAEEIRKAAVFEELSRWKVPMTLVADSFDTVLEEYQAMWILAAKDTKPVFLVMSWNASFNGWKMTTDEPGLQMIQDSPGRKAKSKNETIDIPSSAIVINLSRLFRWLSF
jgi:hypothetical protein